MDLHFVQYVGFFVAALILTWAVVEVNRRYLRQRKVDREGLGTWVKLDSSAVDATEEAEPGVEDDDQEDAPGHRIRAKQNGHHPERIKPL